MHNAVDTALAQGKIEADALAKIYRENIKWAKDNASDFGFLFKNDFELFVSKPPEDFKNLINARISEYKDLQAKKSAEQSKSVEPIKNQENALPTTQTKASQYQTDSLKNKTFTDVKTGEILQSKREMPTSDEIIEVLSNHFNVSQEEAFHWLCELDLLELA